MSQMQVSERVDACRVSILQKPTGSFRATLGGRLRFVSVGLREVRVGVPQSMHLLTIKKPPNRVAGKIASLLDHLICESAPSGIGNQREIATAQNLSRYCANR